MDITIKRCSKCGRLLPLEDFTTDNRRKDGKSSYCKECVKKYYLANRSKIIRRTQERNKANKTQKSAYDKSRRKELKNIVESLKTPCVKCGETRMYLIQFHHIDPAVKVADVGNMPYKKTSFTTDDIVSESKKCVCLCSNCHTEFHYMYGINPKHPVEAIKEYLQSAIYKALKGYSDFGEKLFNEYMTEYTKSYAGRR